MRLKKHNPDLKGTIAANPVIEVKNVSFRYANAYVLENISFGINGGDYLGIIGPNGAGKTTLLKILLGLLKPEKGTVKIFGHDMNFKKNRTLIGYVPQKSSQAAADFPATVYEVVKSGRTAGLGLFNNPKKEDREKIDWAMKITGVEQFKNESINGLSGGQRQRVFIARALAAEPKILFLDEPTIAVDTAASTAFYELLHKLNEAYGLTILFVSHDLDVVAREVSSVLCLKKTLVCHGSPKDFLKKENLEQLYGEKYKFIAHH